MINPIFKGSKKSAKQVSASISQKTISQYCKTKSSDKILSGEKIVNDKENRTKESMENEIRDLTSTDTVSEDYWKEFAEQQREALVEVMEENKNLHEKNAQLQKENEELLVENGELKEEIERLQLYVSKAEELAKLLESVTEDSS